jgi:hypothetical protein
MISEVSTIVFLLGRIISDPYQIYWQLATIRWGLHDVQTFRNNFCPGKRKNKIFPVPK